MKNYSIDELLQKIEILEEENERLRCEERNEKNRVNVLQVILDNIPAPIYLKDIEGRYILVNKKYESFGISPLTTEENSFGILILL